MASLSLNITEFNLEKRGDIKLRYFPLFSPTSSNKFGHVLSKEKIDSLITENNEIDVNILLHCRLKIQIPL